MNSQAEIITATMDHLDDLVPLFDAYRVFYKQESDPQKARAFLSQRMYLGESVIFLAYFDSTAVGFTQLYPSFSSTVAERIWILNDLYIVPDLRGKRIGSLLIQKAKSFAEQFHAAALTLATSKSNLSGQKLYEREGFKLDDKYLDYYWLVPGSE